MRMIGKSVLAAGALSLALTSGIFIGHAVADQPHMQSALDSLQAAKTDLEYATHNKGGHRVEALRLTNEAIRETRAGIEAAEW